MSQYPPHGQQQPGWPPTQYPPPMGAPPPQPPNKKVPTWAVVLVLVVAIPSILCCGGFGILAWIGGNGPDTYAVPGGQIKASVRQEMKTLGINPQDEDVVWFYSDGFGKAEEGMYFFTPTELTLYSSDWSPAKVTVPLKDIRDLSAHFNNSVIDDSIITVTTNGGKSYDFPVASERGGDQKFYDSLQRAVKDAGGSTGE